MNAGLQLAQRWERDGISLDWRLSGAKLLIKLTLQLLSVFWRLLVLWCHSGRFSLSLSSKVRQSGAIQRDTQDGSSFQNQNQTKFLQKPWWICSLLETGEWEWDLILSTVKIKKAVHMAISRYTYYKVSVSCFNLTTNINRPSYY